MYHNILMVSDFFYPNFGGVENHIYHLSQLLLQMGHQVAVVTHAYGDRSGVRYLTNGLKVYYVPRLPFYCQNTFPTFFGFFRLFRCIVVREQTTIIHAHQAFSVLAQEAIMFGRTMGYKVVFTDHSLFGFAEAGSILMNKVLKFTLCDVHQVICVSHTSKENTVLRACLPPHRVSVIPNAADASQFTPDPSRRPCDRIVIVVLCRLVYRKGIDILAAMIPAVCAAHQHVDFLIGGDGPKRGVLQDMIDGAGLAGRVKMVGAVPHEKARDVLTQGHIFLNASLTEAFCMALVEAAATGLLVVSTRVGGVPEVLPDHMVLLAEPTPSALLDRVHQAIAIVHSVDPHTFHNQIKSMYSWARIAQRTERVYHHVWCSTRDDSFVVRLMRHLRCGVVFGPICACVMCVMWLYWRAMEWLCPSRDIDIAPKFPSQKYMAGHDAGVDNVLKQE